MLDGGFLTVFLGSVVSIVGPNMLVILMLSSESEGWLGGSAFMLRFIFFGQSFCLEIAVGLLEGSEDSHVVGLHFLSFWLIFFLMGLQLDRVFFMLGLGMHCPSSWIELHLFPKEVLHGYFDIIDSAFLTQLDVDTGGMRFVGPGK